MRDTLLHFVVSLVVAVAFVAMPATAADSPPVASRPRLGLVLSGGGARGYAHLGVLRVLEQNRIPVDYVAGTSMGAVVGGLYASGIPVEDLITRLSKIDLTNIAFDRNERADLSQALREDEYPIGIAEIALLRAARPRLRRHADQLAHRCSRPATSRRARASAWDVLAAVASISPPAAPCDRQAARACQRHQRALR